MFCFYMECCFACTLSKTKHTKGGFIRIYQANVKKLRDINAALEKFLDK